MPKTYLFLLTILLGHICIDAAWTRFSDPYEIYFSSVTKTWSQASSDCESRGMHLIKVVSSSLTSIISANSGEARWIGASDLASEGNWVWQDGTSATKSSSYHNWNRIEPNGGRTENCAVAGGDGGWVDYACGRKEKYICQKTTYYTDLYQFDFFDLKKTWESAKQFCQKNGYHLVKIDSDSLTSFIASQSSEGRWIGASDTAKEGQWKWSDGTIVNDTAGVYSNWKDGEPSNGATGEDCAFVKSNGKWDDAYCWYTKKFICQKDLPLSVSYKNHLYTFHRKERVDWDTAKNACASRGSRLVEIHSSATNNVIKNKIGNRNRDAQFFSGGNEAHYKKITWDSGTTTSYTSGWASGEPNNSQEKKITLSIKGWYDVRASQKFPYICEMANVSAVTVPNKPLVIGEGNAVKAICSADGVPWAKMSWNFSSIEVAANSSATIYQTKSNGRSVLKAENALLTDEGTYKCIAENQAGNFSFTISKEFNVTVPSVPEYVYAEVQECLPAINIRWRSNSRARNVRHKITIKNVENANDTYELQNLITDVVFTVNVKEWQTYNLTITPCPADICKGQYALSNLTRNPIVGRPGKASNVTVNQSSKYSCSIKWQRPVDMTSDYVTNYKVIVGENFAYHPAGSTDRISEITVVKNQTAYAVKEKPNIRYNFGVQAGTCVGFGDIVWLNGSCVTDPQAPDNIEKPVASPNTGVDGTALVTINIPSQENGRISCLFVIVTVHNGSVLPNNYTSNYTRDDLIRANASTNTNEYIAVALSYESVSKNNRVILGDERITQCDLSSTAKRRKRSDGNNVFVGRNLKLDASKNNSVLIVTSSPTRGDNLLKASESVRVVPATGSATTSATTAVVGGVLGGLIAILLILIVVILLLKKRK